MGHTDGNPLVNVIRSSWIWHFFNTQYLAIKLEQENKTLNYYQTWLRERQYWQFVIYKVKPVIVTIVLVVGMTGNGILLTIFVRHKETRTNTNSMLINLTVIDCVSLVVNVILEYVRQTKKWQLGLFVCQIYAFFSYGLFAVSTYSVAMISVQRFVAVRQLPSLAWFHQSQKTKYVLIATVWEIGFILSVTHAAAAYSETESCTAVTIGNAIPTFTADLITFCVVPLLITAVSSGLTAYKTRRSASEIPGEATGQQQLQHSRMVSSTVLFALTVLFVVSYAPFYLYAFLNTTFNISISGREHILVSTILYHLRFVNRCLNPVVLFVLSKRYRGYIKRYCGQGEVQTATNSGISTETSL